MADGALHVGILGLSGQSYGGDSYLRALLPALEEHAHGARFTVLVKDPRHVRSLAVPERVRLVACDVTPFRSGVARALWEQIVLPERLSRLGVDVVYTTTNVGLLRSRVPSVTFVRNMEPLTQAAPGTPLRFRLRLVALAWLTRISARRAARVAAASKFVRDTLVSQGVPGGRIDVIYHGIDDVPLAAPPPTRPAGGYVAAVAKFVRYANLAMLMRTFAGMRRRGYAGELWFAGGPYDGRYEAEIRRLVRALGVEPHVRFLGYVQRQEVQGMIRGCDVFLFPSTLEACPFTLLEAMRQGAAIVATTCRPMPEIGGDTVEYAPPCDHEAFADAAHRIASSEDLRRAMGERAMARAGAFTWGRAVTRLVATLRAAAGVAE